MSLRLFAAIAIPEDLHPGLRALQRDLAGAAWRPPEAFHLTLRFFGEIDEPTAHDLDAECARLREAPFEMRLVGVGSFGGREPHAVWAGVEAPEALARLASGCERAARRCGLAPETRPFTPHVTLAYCAGTTDADAARYQERFAAYRSPPFWVDRFVFFSSWATRRTRAYVEEAVFPLEA